jgi:hypothetical protein
MKTHEHALISLGYAAGVSFIAGNGFFDPWVYIISVIGGETIDFIDHPLYHLVYNRNEPHVKEARKMLTKGKWREAINYLNEIEDKREFKGLLLHNVFSLTIIALLSLIFSLFFHGQVYPFIFLGSFLLHMLTDIFGDFQILGHCDNWLWVLSPNALKKLGNLGDKLVVLVILWSGLVLSSFSLVSFRWGWQLATKSKEGLLFDNIFMSWQNLSYIPLLVLSAYFFMILTLSIAQTHKYKLEIGAAAIKSAVPFSLGSPSFLLAFLRGKVKRTRLNLEQVILKMQADAGIWSFILAGMIAVILLMLTVIWGKPSLWSVEWQVLFLLIPVFLALFFGTFIHTTSGEVGGVLGVLSAWLINLFLSRLGLMELWGIQFGYFLFIAAMGAWILGLLGGIILKGQSRMSLIAFSMQINPKRKDEKDIKWFNEVIHIVREGLQNGYHNTHNQIYGKDNKGKEYVKASINEVVLTPYSGIPILGEDYHHFQADDSYIPALREMTYVLCDNRLSDQNSQKAEFGILPVLPRHRILANASTYADMKWDGTAYKWLSNKRNVSIECANKVLETGSADFQWGLIKTWSEVIDNTLTRKSTIQTDIFIYPEVDQKNVVTVCGVTREYTSTKEYATIEAEAYASSVVNSIRKLTNNSPSMCVKREASARFFYPRTSFYDQNLINWAEKLASLPSDESEFSRSDLSFIRKSLESLPDKNLLPSVTANLKSKVLVLFGQYFVAGVVGFFNLDPKFVDFLKDLIGNLFSK